MVTSDEAGRLVARKRRMSGCEIGFGHQEYCARY
jgi:hypothetical protein